MPSLPSPIRAIASQPGQWVVPDCCRERVTCARTMNPVDATTSRNWHASHRITLELTRFRGGLRGLVDQGRAVAGWSWTCFGEVEGS